MQPDESTARPLAALLTTLAETPDDDVSSVDATLERLIQLVIATVPDVDYASSTVRRDGRHSTVAFSNALALAVDQAQYDGDAGPCLDAAGGTLSSVADTVTLVQWPRFREAAVQMGLQSALSIPLFTASGDPTMALNLYASRPAALMKLALAVEVELHRPRRLQRHGMPGPGAGLDAGSADLVRGIGAALDIRDLIQRAIGMVMALDHLDAPDAYAALRVQAAEAGRPMLEQARALTAPQGA